jgi:signal transduction histidine kinase
MLYSRNSWFIKVRYFAILAFLLFIFSTATVIPLNLALPQILIMSIILLLLLISNFFLAYLLRSYEPSKEPSRLFEISVAQIVIDLLSLSMIIYITGGIESPFLYLYVFHVIISGLLLPLRLTIAMTILIIMATCTVTLLEFQGLIAHLSLGGLFTIPMYRSPVYLMSSLLTLSFVLSISLLITSVISQDFHKIYTKLLNAIREIEEAEKQKQRYVMAVVHEIKSPLTAVSALLRLIVNNVLGEIPEPVTQRLHRALLRTDEAVDLTNTVLKISRLRLLNEKADESTDVEETINTLLDKLKPMTDEKQIEISMSRAMGKPNLVKGDSFLLSLALSNILQNAVKYTPACGELRIDFSTDGGGKIIIKISDNGIGIPKEELPKVFRDFFRAKAAQDMQIEGTGVGLSVVKQIIEQHGGTISIESPSEFGNSEHPGVTVTVSLPV